jgi:hypothetical protein
MVEVGIAEYFGIGEALGIVGTMFHSSVFL